MDQQARKQKHVARTATLSLSKTSTKPDLDDAHGSTLAMAKHLDRPCIQQMTEKTPKLKKSGFE